LLSAVQQLESLELEADDTSPTAEDNEPV